MEKVSFYESVLKVLNVISSMPLFIEILILTVILLIIMIFFYFKKTKVGRVTALIIYCVSILLLPITHFSFFIDTFDKIIENYIKLLYFPPFYAYVAILIITDITLLASMIKNINNHSKKWYMIINLIYFGIFQFLFFVIVRLIISNNIDVFEITNLYSNVELTSCLQISSYLFWVRVGILLVVRLINKLADFEANTKKKVANQNVEEEKREIQESGNQELGIPISEDNKLLESLLQMPATSNIVMPIEMEESAKNNNFVNASQANSITNNEIAFDNSSEIHTNLDSNSDLDILEEKKEDNDYFYDDFFE